MSLLQTEIGYDGAAIPHSLYATNPMQKYNLTWLQLWFLYSNTYILLLLEIDNKKSPYP